MCGSCIIVTFSLMNTLHKDRVKEKEKALRRQSITLYMAYILLPQKHSMSTYILLKSNGGSKEMFLPEA